MLDLKTDYQLENIKNIINNNDVKNMPCFVYEASFVGHPIVTQYLLECLKIQRTHNHTASMNLYKSLRESQTTLAFQDVYAKMYREAKVISSLNDKTKLGLTAEELMMSVLKLYNVYELLALKIMKQTSRAYTPSMQSDDLHKGINQQLDDTCATQSLHFLRKTESKDFKYPNGFPMTFENCKVTKQYLAQHTFMVELRNHPLGSVTKEGVSQQGMKLLFYCAGDMFDKKFMLSLMNGVMDYSIAFKHTLPRIVRIPGKHKYES